MKKYLHNRGLLLCIAIGALSVAQSVLAVGTDSGTVISNQATLTYTVNSIAQPAVLSDDDGAGNDATTFVVDNRVIVTVAELGGNIQSGPNGSQRGALFRITNSGNTTQSYALSAIDQNTGQTVTIAATLYTDDTNNAVAATQLSSIQFYIDDGDGVFEPGADDGAAVTGSGDVAEDGTVDVWLAANLPSGAPDGALALAALVATTADAGSSGAAVTAEDTDGDDPTAVEAVFADAAGSDDAANDGEHSARDVFQVQSAQISLLKTSAVIDDGIGGGGSELAVPGATVEYTITINNTGSADADLSQIADSLNAEITAGNVAFVVDAYDGQGSGACAANCGVLVTAPDVNGGAAESYTTAVDADGADFDAGGTNALTVTNTALGSLSPTESATIQFRVVIQ